MTALFEKKSQVFGCYCIGLCAAFFLAVIFIPFITLVLQRIDTSPQDKDGTDNPALDAMSRRVRMLINRIEQEKKQVAPNTATRTTMEHTQADLETLDSDLKQVIVAHLSHPLNSAAAEVTAHLKAFDERLAGKWLWQETHEVEFSVDRQVISDNGESAIWDWIGPNYRQISLHWLSGKFVDTMTLSDSFLQLSGKNQKGESVRAIRTKVPTRR